jgi:hypothetical protein
MLHRARKQLRDQLTGWWNNDSQPGSRLNSIHL